MVVSRFYSFIEEKFDSIISLSWWKGTTFKYAIPYMSFKSALQIRCLQWSNTEVYGSHLSWPCPVNDKKKSVLIRGFKLNLQWKLHADLNFQAKTCSCFLFFSPKSLILAQTQFHQRVSAVRLMHSSTRSKIMRSCSAENVNVREEHITIFALHSSSMTANSDYPFLNSRGYGDMN